MLRASGQFPSSDADDMLDLIDQLTEAIACDSTVRVTTALGDLATTQRVNDFKEQRPVS